MTMNDDLQTRREMCRTALRCLALGGVGLLSAALVGRSSAEGCPRQAPCRDCAALAACRLPQALETRHRDQD
jgi:hypothetical protein